MNFEVANGDIKLGTIQLLKMAQGHVSDIAECHRYIDFSTSVINGREKRLIEKIGKIAGAMLFE